MRPLGRERRRRGYSGGAKCRQDPVADGTCVFLLAFILATSAAGPATVRDGDFQRDGFRRRRRRLRSDRRRLRHPGLGLVRSAALTRAGDPSVVIVRQSESFAEVARFGRADDPVTTGLE
jgi:hypothetical protein